MRIKRVKKGIEWTEALDALLVGLWNKGGSLQYVAREMNKLGYAVTRNSIAGRKHRLPKDLFTRTPNSYPENFVKSPPPQLKPRPPTPAPIHVQGSNVMPFPAAETTDTAGTVIHNDGVEYLLNSENGCKALLDARGPDGLPKCCGKARSLDYRGNKSSYCRSHYRLFHNNPPGYRSANG